MKRLIKKMVPLTIVLCIVFSVCVTANASVANELSGHWAGETLTQWVKLGLLKGDNNGNYNPDKEISRAEFMALVNRVMNYTAKSDSIRKFTDVSANNWYYADASKALAAGYINGTTAKTLSPEDTITREQAITIISRIKGIDQDGDVGILSKVSDSTRISEWAKGPIAGAIREGLVTGSNGRINPKTNTTHSEAVVLLDRVRTDTRMYYFAGTYGPESATATAGNVVIASPGIKLRNLIVAGNLEIAKAVSEGEATLDNVIVNGKLVAKGGNPKIIAAKDDSGGSQDDGDSQGGGGSAGGGSKGGGSKGGGKKDDDDDDDLATPTTANITSISPIKATAGHNELYELPAKIDVNLSNGKTAQLDVSWAPCSVSTMYCGEFTFEGVVTETAEIKNPQIIKTNLTLTVVPVVVGISITNPPSKLVCKTGEALDLTGLVVTGTYSDNTTKTEKVSMSNISGYNSRNEGEKTVTVTIGGKTDTFKVNVIPSETPQQNIYYIRERASGDETGTDWNNAYKKLPDVLERGATYYIASGTYPSYKFDDPEQGDSYIVVKKATVNDYGTDVGWKNGYGGGVVEFTDEKGPIFQFSTGYYIIDGQTGSEDSGHGIKLYNPMNIEPHKGGNCMQIPNGTEVRHLTLRHIEMEDAGWAGSGKDEAYKTRTVYATGTTAHITFQYCYIHESGQEWMLFSSPKSDFLVEHCYFKNGGSGSSDYHSVGVWHRSSGGDMNIHIRYNTFENFAAAGGTGYISLGYRGDENVETYSSGYYIYGNIFKETSPLAGPSRAIGSNGANGGPFLSDVKIFNNTFYNMHNNSSNINLANTGSMNLAANNIWYGCEREVPNVNIESKSNILNDLPEDPFVDATNGNFWLSRELPGGMELDEPFNKDSDGAVRGADNVWDIGAYEYVKTNDMRARIENNTIVAPDASRLRGGTFWLYGWISSKTSWALSDAPWQAIHDNELNAVRIACAYRPEKEGNYSLDKYVELLDQLIDRAENEGVTAVIDYHPEPGNYYNTSTGDELDTYENNKKHAREFWTRMASRYKDRKNVVFELVNEPIFDSPNDYNGELLKDFSELWQLCHDLAPDTPIIVLSFCQVGGHASDTKDWPSERAGWLEGIDWRKTAVGFHSYWSNTSERIVELMSKYPCINTEFMTYTDGSGMKAMDEYEHHGTLMETLDISWLQWDIVDRPESLEKLEVVIQDLKDKGLYWGDN